MTTTPEPAKQQTSQCLKCCVCHTKRTRTSVLQGPKFGACSHKCNNLELQGLSILWAIAPATQNAKGQFRCFKITIPQGTAETHHSYGHKAAKQTVANGCEWVRTAANRTNPNTMPSKHLLPQTPKVQGESDPDSLLQSNVAVHQCTNWNARCQNNCIALLNIWRAPKGEKRRALMSRVGSTAMNLS